MTITAAADGSTGTVRTAHAFDDELARLDGVATAAAVRAGELRADEVVAAAIARSRALDPAIHAVATEDYERALAAAPTATTGAFAGVPTFVKDMTDVAGLATRNGSLAFAGAAPATTTAGLAEQLFDMGMVGLGKSTLPEFGFIPGSEPAGAAPTRNPWNLDRSTGGSSAGAAALVASGVVPVAHGADGGGSIRIPAACCGLVGMKATRGRLRPPPEARLMPVDVEVEGLLTRTVRDTALFFAEAERRHHDPRLVPVGHVTEPLTGRLRVGAVLESPTGEPVDEATRTAFDATISLLEGLGHRVAPVPLPADERFAEDFVQYWSSLAWAVSVQGKRLFDESFEPAQLTELTRGLARRFRARWWREPGAIVRLRRSAAVYAEAMAGLDVLVSPTVATVAHEVGHFSMGLPFDVVFPRAEAWVGYTPLANATGAPALSLPLHRDPATNLPVGIMFSAAHGDEALLLRLALQLEEAAPWPLLGDAAPPPAAA